MLATAGFLVFARSHRDTLVLKRDSVTCMKVSRSVRELEDAGHREQRRP